MPARRVLYALMRQLRPEFAPLVALAGVGVILVQLIGVLLNVSSTVENLISLAGLEKENVEILIKALAVCVITQFASDVCYDNSFSSAAAAVELAGRSGDSPRHADDKGCRRDSDRIDKCMKRPFSAPSRR